jgi:hypothetical protein
MGRYLGPGYRRPNCKRSPTALSVFAIRGRVAATDGRIIGNIKSNITKEIIGMADDENWQPFGESKWRELAATASASELQLKFCVARFNGSSAAAAAAIAGYSGSKDELRRAGYSAVRSTAVVTLLELAEVNAPDQTELTDQEVDRKIAKLVRSPDPNVSLKSAELYEKRKQRARELGQTPEDDAFSGDRFVRSLLLLPNGASMAMLLQAGTSLSRMCLFHDMHHKLKEEPLGQTIWNHLFERHSDVMKDDIARVLGDLSWQSDDRVRLWAEIGMKPIAPTSMEAASV